MAAIRSALASVAVTPPRGVIPAVGSMVALAGLDLVGAVLARHWADQRAVISLIGGMAAFALLFVVYGKSLDYAELSTVTVGWVVLLQIGVVILEKLDGVAVPAWKLGVIAVIMMLQAVLTLGDLRG